MMDDWHMSQRRLAALVAKNVAAFGRLSVEERFEYLVRRGILDRQCRVTTRAGGDAEPDPSADPITEM